MSPLVNQRIDRRVLIEIMPNRNPETSVIVLPRMPEVNLPHSPHRHRELRIGRSQLADE
jgi:hypothetical protein